MDKLESQADHFALEDRLEAKSIAHATDLLERAKTRRERMATNTRRDQPGEGDGHHGQAAADPQAEPTNAPMLVSFCLRVIPNDWAEGRSWQEALGPGLPAQC